MQNSFFSRSDLRDPSRRKMLIALAHAPLLPASALAELAGVTKATASHHLAVLLEADLIEMERRGSYRLFRLKGSTTLDRELEGLWSSDWIDGGR